jgi:hypothetical protein
MIAEDIRRAVMAASRDRLTELSAALWQAFSANAVTEDDASEISALIEARKTVPATASQKPRRPPKPRDPVHVERRRRWAASGWLPPKLATRFTPSETAALAVVAWQCAVSGVCTLPLGRIANLAGVSRTKAKDAIRLARTLGMLGVEQRRRARKRSDTNVVRIRCAAWSSWIEGVRGRRLFRGQGGGVGKSAAFNTGDTGGAVGADRKGLPGRRTGSATAFPPRRIPGSGTGR